jgi:RNA polymerase sigma-70 factor (ECF subfamily)
MEDENKLSDEELVQKIRTSDKELYTKIIDRYQAKLLRYARNLTRDENKAIDAVQESFIKAFVNLNSFDKKKKFSSWIYRIAHNEIINILKKHKWETPLLEEWDFESKENIEDNFKQQENKDEIEKCLKDMPIIYSEPLSLFFLEEKSYEEISDILRTPMGTVATRINRAKKLIKKLCQKN